MLDDLRQLLRHLDQGDRARRRDWFATSAVLVLAKLALLYAQIEALRRQREGAGQTRELLIFAAACGLWFVCQRSLWRSTARALGQQTRALGDRIVSGLVRLPLDRFEALDRDQITLRLTGDSQRVAAATYPLISLSQSAVRLGLGALYAVLIVPEAGWAAVGALALMAALVTAHVGPMRDGFRDAAAEESRLYGQLRGLLGGAVLVRLHGPRLRALRAAIQGTSDRLHRLRVGVMDRFFGQRYASTALLYAILGFNVFVLPLITTTDLYAIRELNWILVWVVSSVIGIIFALPELSRAAGALARLQALDGRVAADAVESLRPPDPARFAGFEHIDVEGLRFGYPDTDRRSGFDVGPIDARFRRGEVVFLTGHNGSGKSTFLKMLTGLYRAEAGAIRVDGQPIDEAALADYRGLFATIFTDHHLFERTFGVEPAAEADAGRLLAAMQIADKTAIVGGRVLDRDLSTGQKKRLAMVIAQLRRRPILLLDEWAADQDPAFRAAFYHQLLPALRDEGRLVIAVSHDDQYFHCADRVLHFRDGRLVEAPPAERPPTRASSIDPAGAGGSTDRPRPPTGRGGPSVRGEGRPAGGSALYGLLGRYGVGPLQRPIAIAALGGALGAGLVALVNSGAALALGGSALAGLGFLAGVGAMLWCNRRGSRAAVQIFEDVQRGLRDELADGLSGAPLRVVERLGGRHGQVFGDLVYLTMAVTPQVSVIQHGAVVLSVTLVLALLSAKALLIWLVTIGLIGGRLLPRIRELRVIRRRLSAQGRRLDAAIEELLAGFKQVKLDPEAAAELVADIHRLHAETADGRVEAEAHKDASMSSANLLFYGIGLGIPLFAPAATLGLGPELAYEVVLLLSLSLGSLYGLLQAMPALGQAETTARSVVEVLDRLATSAREAPGEPGGAVRTLRFEGVRFSYEVGGFTVGPLDLTLESGQLAMVTGRNGAGKTTLMKMLAGLYPTTGRIVWDGAPLTGSRLADYRGLFTVVLGEQHLFDRLYGLDVAPDDVQRVLERLGIDDAVAFDGQTFGGLSLSSGQRMRLALAVALLEDRPICIFDEWTANQDPETTRFYHDTLLPELLAAGRLVIAVSHDDRYFERADHRLVLDDGALVLDAGPGEGAS